MEDVIELAIKGLLDAGAGMETLVHFLSRVTDEEERAIDPVLDLATAVVGLEKETTKFRNRLRHTECVAEAQEMRVAAHYLSADVHDIADVLLGLGG